MATRIALSVPPPEPTRCPWGSQTGRMRTGGRDEEEEEEESDEAISCWKSLSCTGLEAATRMSEKGDDDMMMRMLRLCRSFEQDHLGTVGR